MTESLVAALLEAVKESGPIGLTASAYKRSVVEAAAVALRGHGVAAPAMLPLRGTYELLYSGSKGGSNGKVGPLSGTVQQIIVDERRFINQVSFFGGSLRIALHADRIPLNETCARVRFRGMVYTLFGKELKRTRMKGDGIWRTDYARVGADGNSAGLRVMRTPSLFVLQQRRDWEGSLGAAIDKVASNADGKHVGAPRANEAAQLLWPYGDDDDDLDALPSGDASPEGLPSETKKDASDRVAYGKRCADGSHEGGGARTRRLASSALAGAGGAVASEGAFHLAWRRRLECWWALLPEATQERLGGCLGALAMHLASRFDSARRSVLAGDISSAGAPLTSPLSFEAEDGCEWLRGRQALDELHLPPTPEFPPSGLREFKLAPAPQLLPRSEELRLLSFVDGEEGARTAQWGRVDPFSGVEGGNRGGSTTERAARIASSGRTQHWHGPEASSSQSTAGGEVEAIGLASGAAAGGFMGATLVLILCRPRAAWTISRRLIK